MLIKLTPRKWETTYYSYCANKQDGSATVNKYRLTLTALSDDEGNYPMLPVSIVEKGNPSEEVYTVTYPDMSRADFISLSDMAFHHRSAIESFESLEDFN